MRERVDDNLYYVEKILRLQEKDGEMYAVIKWENFSYRDVTREKIESLKLNPTLRADLIKKQADFKARPFTKAIEHQLAIDVAILRKKIYDDQSSIKNDDRHREKNEKQNMIEQGDEVVPKPNKEDKPLAPQQLALCRHQAEKLMAKRLRNGLGNLEASDYFKLEDIRQDALQKTKIISSRKALHTELCIQEVKGVYREGNQYKFCLLFKGKVFICNSQKMARLFPRHLYNFLTKFLRYMKSKMRKEIQKEENMIISKRLKAKSIDAVSKMLNITQHMQSQSKAVHFGLDYQDMLNNIYEHKQTFLKPQKQLEQKQGQKGESLAKQSKRKPKSKQKEDKVGLGMAQDLKSLYLAIKNDIVRALAEGISQPEGRATSERKKKSVNYIEISSGPSHSRSKSRGKQQIMQNDSDQFSIRSRSITNRTPSRSRQKVENRKNRSVSGSGRKKGKKRTLSVSVSMSSSDEEQISIKSKDRLKRDPEAGEDASAPLKRFKQQ